MRFTLFSIFIALSINSFAQDPFQVPREEIGKKGLYIIEQPGIPTHKDYEEIHRHNGVRKLQKNPTGKFIVTKFIKAKFKVFAPQTYNPNFPAGILFLGVSNSPGRTIDEVIEYCKKPITQKNLILIVIDTKYPDVLKIGNDILTYSNEYSLLIRRSIDLVKERYKTDQERILSVAAMLESSSLFKTAICCPDLFKNNALYKGPAMFYDNMPNQNGKKIFSFGRQDQEITTINKAAKNSFFLHYMTHAEDNKGKELEQKILDSDTKFFKRNGFNNTEFNEIKINTKFVPEKEAPDKLLLFITSIDKIDPKPFDAKTFLTQALAFEKKNNSPKAFENYKIAAKYGFKEAQEKYNALNKELQESSTSMMKSHLDKNYPEAYKLAQTILKKFGAVSSLQAANIYKTYSKDKKIVLEIKAAAFLFKAEAALKQTPVPKDKIKAACEKVIKTVPGTKTAEMAKKILDGLK